MSSGEIVGVLATWIDDNRSNMMALPIRATLVALAADRALSHRLRG
jgi:hypothetical protein